MLPVLWFVLVLFRLCSVLCEVCDVSDPACTTKSAKNNFGNFVNGVDSIVDASDPLWIDEVVDKRPTITYKLTNASLAGMKDCVVNTMKVDREAKTLFYNLECPHLVITSNYEVKGAIISLNVEGNGVLTVTADSYVFLFTCKYEKTIDEDGNVHVEITNHNYDVEIRGKVAFKYTNLFHGDKLKSDLAHRFINENWQTMVKLFRTPTIDRFVDLFIANLNKFLKYMSVQKLLPNKN